MADDRKRIWLHPGRANEQRFETAWTGRRHRDTQFLAIELVGRGRLDRRPGHHHRQQHRAPHHAPTPRRIQGWKLRMISSVSGVGLRAASSINTVTACAEATHWPAENTT